MIRGVPYDAEVEYLESTGTQWIDTGYVWSNPSNADVEIKLQYVNTTGRQAAFGSGDAFYFACNANRWEWRYGTYTGTVGTEIVNIKKGISNNSEVGTRFYVDGNLVETWAERALLTWWRYSATVFACSFGNSVSMKSQMRCFLVRVWDDGFLIRDFIPVRFTNEQGVSEGAMYDRVTRRLFRNQGTGAFQWGPDVATPVMALHMFQKPPLTTLDYVQDGLVAHWDGIENAGRRVHSHTPVNWKDLTGNGYDGIIGANVVVMDNCMSFNGVKGEANAVKVGKVTFGSPEFVTFETVFIKDHDAEVSVYNEAVFGQTEGKTPGVSLFVKGKLDVQYRPVGLAADVSFIHMGFGSSPFRLRQLTAVSFLYGVDSIALYMNGERVAARTNDGTAIDMTSTNYNFYIGGDAFGPEEYSLQGRVFGLRIYNRALTEAEIAHNYAVDKERFKLP